MNEQRTEETRAECDHRWKYETFFHVVGRPAKDMYRCTRCLKTKWVENPRVICD